MRVDVGEALVGFLKELTGLVKDVRELVAEERNVRKGKGRTTS